jgi:hypothetical protein
MSVSDIKNFTFKISWLKFFDSYAMHTNGWWIFIWTGLKHNLFIELNNIQYFSTKIPEIQSKPKICFQSFIFLICFKRLEPNIL